ncbi:hypothetical protein FOE78_03275 [Microlunatus elymi]|uniref:Uncharacterized protein n=1 Tax=Microlunatus elymi TaxID=2596828 RepID=A0A516PV78_9ACTN|nr:hypothetical protein [Microlunatus elymi]QDP95063.1 hypothetical protein FOE78_03275 [Microlunatus elymi]
MIMLIGAVAALVIVLIRASGRARAIAVIGAALLVLGRLSGYLASAVIKTLIPPPTDPGVYSWIEAASTVTWLVELVLTMGGLASLIWSLIIAQRQTRPSGSAQPPVVTGHPYGSTDPTVGHSQAPRS